MAKSSPSNTSNQVITFGCRLNAYESEVIKHNLALAGESQVAVINSCAVTKEAERQARQAVRKLRRENPNLKIIVTGCAAQTNPSQFSSMPEVDQVLGNEEKLHPKYYQQQERLLVNDIMSVQETALHLSTNLGDKAKAFLQVQNGCDHRCTFCTIPYGRGNSRSVALGEIVEHSRRLVAEGFQEIVLTGVDITDYGKNLPGTPSLGQMVRRLLQLVPELPRLRLSSFDVAELDEDIMELLANEPRFMPYFHISLQAGDNMILKRMKRRHLRDDILNFCERARKLRPEVAFGADMIAGFPTETEEMFQNSLNLVHEAGLVYLHVFPYSERDNTPAARMPKVPVEVRKARASLLRKAGEEELAKFLHSYIGKDLRVLVEQPDQGRAENHALVKFATQQDIGKIVVAKVIAAEAGHLVAEALA